MATPGTAALSEAALRLSTDGGRHAYLLADPASGRILRLSPSVARSVWRSRRLLQGGGRGGSLDELAEAAGIAGYLQGVRRAAVQERPKLNPLFLPVPLFAVAPWQPALEPMARLLVSRLGLGLILLLAALSLWVAVLTDWAMASRLGDVFSLEAILTFAAVAPLLKIAHEFGHVLAATRYRVPVRKAGIFLIGLYPMPFVDCSEADLEARRGQRIVISLGGLAIDLAIGLLAFLLWHVIEDSWTRQLLANVFVFSTLNTLFFNLNPLMKLDGYFALADALNRRNFHLESTLAARKLRDAVARLDLAAARRTVAECHGRLLYALASTAYKIYVLAFIAWHLLPQFLGFGMVLVGWGAAVMFLSPLLNTRLSASGAAEDSRKAPSRWLWLSGFAALALALAFVPFPHRLTVPLGLDLDGSYTLRSAVGGEVTRLRPVGAVARGERLLELEDPEAEAAAALLEREVQLYAALWESAGGRDPLAADAAAERLATAEQVRAAKQREALDRRMAAHEAGWFRPDHRLRPGVRLETGASIGILLPASGEAVLDGRFPELYVEKFREHLVAAELRHADGHLDDADGLKVRLDRVTEDDASSSERRFRVAVTTPLPAKALAGQALHLKLGFESEPLWRHAVFLFNRLHLAFRQAQQLARTAALD